MPIPEFLQSMDYFWILITLSVFMGSGWLYKKSHFFPLFTPIITTITVLIAILQITETSYDRYFQNVHVIHMLLGPVTVALAVPLYRQRAKLLYFWLPIFIGLCVGTVTAIISVCLIGSALGLSHETLLSLIPKSVTTPIAMGISESIGGIPSLTAAIVVITGILGGLLSRPLFRILRCRSNLETGISLGLTAHGMGTNEAFSISQESGAYAGLAMGLTGLLTAFIAPYIGLWLLEILP